MEMESVKVSMMIVLMNTGIGIPKTRTYNVRGTSRQLSWRLTFIEATHIRVVPIGAR